MDKQLLSPKLATALKWVAGLGAAAILAPAILLAVQGIAGLIVALALGTIAIKFAPAFGAITSNYAMKLLRWDARKNPIETKWNHYRKNVAYIDEREAKLKSFNGSIEAYESKVEQFTKENPADAKRFQEHLAAMKQLREFRYAALKKARQKLAEQKKQIERASDIWDMSQAAKNMDQAAGLISEKDAIMQIQEMEANSSIEKEMAASFAELDHAIRTELDTFIAEGSKKLDYNPSDVIDMETTSSRQAEVIPLKKASAK